MFVILWSLGKKKNYKVFRISKNKYIKFYLLYKNKTETLRKTSQFNSISYGQVRKYYSWGSYLAGLVEGDGYIAVQDKNTEKKVIHRPKIIIAFNIHDKPLADKLTVDLKVGKVISKPREGHVILQILSKEEVLKIIQLINGYMRTPKIEALHRAIYWINEKDNSSIPYLGLDKSPLDSNGWLAGFTDSDWCFSIIVHNRKKKGVFLRTSVQTFFRIEVKQNYSREVTLEQGGSSFFYIMS